MSVPFSAGGCETFKGSREGQVRGRVARPGSLAQEGSIAHAGPEFRGPRRLEQGVALFAVARAGGPGIAQPHVGPERARFVPELQRQRRKGRQVPRMLSDSIRLAKGVQRLARLAPLLMELAGRLLPEGETFA